MIKFDKVVGFGAGLGKFVMVIMDSFSTHGAIILILTSLTFYGMVHNNKDIWNSFGASLMTYLVGKKIGSDGKENKE